MLLNKFDKKYVSYEKYVSIILKQLTHYISKRIRPPIWDGAFNRFTWKPTKRTKPTKQTTGSGPGN